MNKTERLFYNYLVEKGLTEKKILRIKHGSPDFVVEKKNKKIGYEVKLLIGKSIYFYPGQFKKITKNNFEQFIVIMKKGMITPLKIIPFKDIQDKNRQNIRGYTIHIAPERKGIMVYNLEVDTPLWEKFKACLRKVYWKEGCDINEGLIKLIKKFVEEKGEIENE